MSDILDAVRNLQKVWTSADHTRQCGARYNSGACTCGYDSLLDFTITQVINHLEDDAKPLTKAEVDAMMTALSRAAMQEIVKGNALMSALSGDKQ